MTVHFVTVGAADLSAVGEARRTVMNLADELEFNETVRGKTSIVATELSGNLARHASGGELVLQSISNNGRRWIELTSIDRGPGMPDVDRCLQDGYSTAGTPGTGLGAVRRLSTEFDLYSAQPGGTVVFSRIDSDDHRKLEHRQEFRWAALSRPAPHEKYCGDCWSVGERSGEFAILMADGLGHGPEAAAAATVAADTFEQDPFAPLTTIFETANRRMHGTRGAAVAVARIDVKSRAMKFAGIGNISGHLRALDEQSGRGLCSHNGTMGVQVRKVQEFDYECPPHGLLVMHSDGLQSRWSLDAYPGLMHRHPGVAAGILHRDFTRGRDDVTVAVIRMTLAQR